MKGAPPGALGRCHPSGWIQTELFTEWFNHFIQKTRPSEESPILLILDGHSTHTRNLQVIDLAHTNHVTIVSIPPHSSHKTQPLDKTFMGPLKTYYSEYVGQFLRHSERPVGPYDIAELFRKAYIQCQTALIAARGFRVTGIFPCDGNVFQDVDFLPSESSLQTEAFSHLQVPVIILHVAPCLLLEMLDMLECHTILFGPVISIYKKLALQINLLHVFHLEI